jgi:hypothetical protein
MLVKMDKIFDKECLFVKNGLLSNILSIFTNFLYQISCPFLQTFFIKYFVHFYKHSLSNILSQGDVVINLFELSLTSLKNKDGVI